MRRFWLLAIAHGVVAEAPGPCAGKRLDGPAVDVLRGAHLKVLELEWSPFAYKDAAARHGWSGYDIDLFSEVANILGFTFEISETSMMPDETYTQFLLRTVGTADLWLSWWLRSTERMDGSIMLSGHVDASGLLVAPPPKYKKSKSITENMFTLFAPFDIALWVCIVSLIVLSGVIDWVLEYGNPLSGKLKSSIYEYAAGVLWGGFPDPQTNLSAIFQVTNGLVIMIIVAAYTANLAAFLAVKPEPSVSFGTSGWRSMADLREERVPVCSIGAYSAQAVLDATLDLAFDSTSQTSYKRVGAALLSDACEAAILPKVDYDSLVADGAYCELSTIGPSLYNEMGGWVTGLNASLCIQRPIEYALHVLQAKGRVVALWDLHMPRADCPAEGTSGSTAAAAAARRRLQQTGTPRPAPHRRRMKGGSGGAGGAVPAVAEDEEEEDTAVMTPVHFFGIFIIWIVSATCLLVARLVLYLNSRFGICVVKVGRASDTPTLQAEAELSSQWMIDARMKDVDLNNAQSMLRFLLSELSQMKRAVSTPASPPTSQSPRLPTVLGDHDAEPQPAPNRQLERLEALGAMASSAGSGSKGPLQLAPHLQHLVEPADASPKGGKHMEHARNGGVSDPYEVLPEASERRKHRRVRKDSASAASGVSAGVSPRRTKTAHTSTSTNMPSERNQWTI